ncbi:hypothetical protein BGZ76_005493 [Entomortierella beljakovae]|nr:hypothetical protein BGZ76_005493 [Entomortierella beljakovae]
MARPNRDYCCCCIPLRGAVVIISLIVLAIGGLNLWSILRVDSTDTTSKIAGYISAGVYGLLGICGILCALIKTYALAKNFSVLWWTVTIITTILAVINVILTATRDKETLQGVCRYTLINDPGLNHNYDDIDVLEKDVQTCYNLYIVIAGISLGIQVLLMSLFGWVASRYTGEVKHMHDNEHLGQVPVQAQVPETQYKS